MTASSTPMSATETAALHKPDITDSDGCSADLYYVALHKVFKHTPDKNLDTLVARLKSDRLYTLYFTLCSNIQLSRAGFHGLKYVDTNKHGIRLWQHYLHRHVMSSKYELTITPLLKPILYAHGKVISDCHDFWTGLPKLITSLQDLGKLSSKLGSWDICVGNHEDCYVSMIPPGRTIHESARNPAAAYREDVLAERDDHEYAVRAVKCSLLVRNQTCCSPCKLYRCTLRSRASREKNIKENSFDLKKTSHKHMANVNLIMKIGVIHCEKKGVQDELKRLKKQVINVKQTKSNIMTQAESEDILKLVSEYKGEVKSSFPNENSTQRLFWEQQLKFASLKNKKSMRWHPMIIKWCLYLKSKSQKAYDAARSSGFISLPSSRTLFDFSHALPSKCGFDPRYTEHLKQEAEYKSYVGILQDEIKVSEGLVYDRKSGELVGYVDLDKTGNDIINLEHTWNDTSQKLASSLLVVMVRGITTSLKYPFFCLATSGITAATLYSPIYETIRVLEVECALKPLFITCDGATPNRKFFKLQAVDNDVNTFWTWNVYPYPPRKLYFISDVPHLLQTTRNCFPAQGHIAWQGINGRMERTFCGLTFCNSMKSMWNRHSTITAQN